MLNGMNKMAGNLFARAASAAEVQAKKFEAQYEQIKHDQAIDTLTSFEMALNAALKPMVPEILSGIQEVFALELMQSNEELEYNVGRKFDHLQSLLPPKDLPTVDDVLAANELLAEGFQQYDEHVWPQREDRLIDRIADVFRGTLRDLAESINRERARRSAGSGTRHLTLEGPKGVTTVEAESEPSMMDRVSGLLGAPAGSVSGPAGMSAAGTGTTISSGALTAGGTKPVAIKLSNSAESAIEKAAADQTALYKKLYDFLSGSRGHTGDAHEGGVQGDLNEEDRADIWWRSFRNWMGSDLGKKARKQRNEDPSWLSWLKRLGPLLASMVLDPELYKEMGALMDKYLTWDNVVKVFTEAWSVVSKAASDTIDWAMDKLGIKKPDNRVGKDMSPAGGNNPDFDYTKTGDPYKNGGPPGAAAGVSMPVPVGPKRDLPIPTDEEYARGTYTQNLMRALGLNVGGSTTSQQLTVNNRSTLIPPPAGMAGLGSTFSVPVNSALMKPGVSMNPNSMAVVPEHSEFTLPGAARGTTQVGLGTFGFTAGTSDSLLMMNSHYFTS